MLFLQADIRERQAKLSQAKRNWEKYQHHATSKIVGDDSAASGKLYPETAKERLKQIEARKERQEAADKVIKRVKAYAEKKKKKKE